MTKREIESLTESIYKQRPWIYRTDITAILEMLNNKGLLHPSHDDTFLWDKEILETEYPKICAEIRADERRKVIDTIKWNIEELAKRG